jgi:hypothetical protein
VRRRLSGSAGAGRLVAVLALLCAPSLASGHGTGPAASRAVLDPLPPALAGIEVQIHETLGTQLVLENRTPRTVEILDENRVAFARVGPAGVEANLAAAAWHRSLGPAAPVPRLSAGAPPRWVTVSAEPAFGWFDPRVAPPRGGDQQAARFEIPLLVDGAPAVLTGRFEHAAAGRSTVRLTSPAAPAPGVRVTLLPGRAAGLLVENRRPETLLVLGQGGEPFLRIGPEGVHANLRSATWRRSARSSGHVEPSQTALRASDAMGAPDWQRVASVPRFGWIEPRAVADPREPSRAFRVPMQLGEQRLELTGVAGFEPFAP